MSALLLFLSVFGALVIMMSRLKVSFFRYHSEHAAENLQLRALSSSSHEAAIYYYTRATCKSPSSSRYTVHIALTENTEYGKQVPPQILSIRQQ